MKNMRKIPLGEQGFVLVAAMVILVVLSIMGISITQMSRVELQISGNDRRVKHSFYKADGGTEIGIELLEENFSCPVGFDTPGGFDSDDASTASYIQIVGVDLFDAKFATDLDITELAKAAPGLPNPASSDEVPTDSYRTIRVPDDPTAHNDTDYHTNVAIYGTTGFSTGSAIQMSAGYHGMGYSAAGGGGVKSMDVLAQYDGAARSVGKIFLEYAHLIGSEGTCRY